MYENQQYIYRFFNVESWLKQGDHISHLHFNLFINDNINNMHCCVKTGIGNVGILLNACDIVLHQSLRISSKILLLVILHFRKVRTKKTDKVFKMEIEK